MFGQILPQHQRGCVLLDRYQILERINAGGMGRLYLALDQRNHAARVAIKENTDLDPDAADRLLEEISFLRCLIHPGLPRLVDRFIEPDGRLYVVMSYVPGRNLEQVRNVRRVSEFEAVRWLVRACEILTYMHTWVDQQSGKRRPVIHQDVKPANLILSEPHGDLVLVDLGIACYAHRRPKGTSRGYSPPEQCRDDGIIEPRSDIFSAGATLLYLLTGDNPPSVERGGWDDELGRLIATASAKPRLRAVIRQAMQPVIEARYPTADHMRTALLEC